MPTSKMSNSKATPDGTSRSRGAMRPSSAKISRPLEGVGNAGCPLHPRPRVHFVLIERTRVTTSTPERPAFPHAMVLTAYVGLSPVTGLFCHRRLADIVLSKPGWADATPQNLTPASGRQDHTILPSAKSVSRQRAVDRSQDQKNPPCDPVARKTLPRPPHPHPASVTIAIRPSGGVGCESCRFDLGWTKAAKFLPMGLDSPNHTKSG